MLYKQEGMCRFMLDKARKFSQASYETLIWCVAHLHAHQQQ